ncbi:hypothetical protein K2173_025133 [Erythroxylum novogranatense]|uniref:Uncharacterized protein n=1 Tax=Erythroxylum novogranatense TaxID=1862640 RepID=A0AAV8SVI2_9ROSI|nr:hypothetical protein K2173_025133 [Erythroxylum novogranatense]
MEKTNAVTAGKNHTRYLSVDPIISSLTDEKAFQGQLTKKFKVDEKQISVLNGRVLGKINDHKPYERRWRQGCVRHPI